MVCHKDNPCGTFFIKADTSKRSKAASKKRSKPKMELSSYAPEDKSL